MKCKRFGESLAGYLDNELTAEEKMAVEKHLSVCANCRQELEGLAQVRRDLSEALRLRSEEVSPSANSWGKIRENISPDSRITFRDWIGGTYRNPVWRSVAPVALVVVAFVSLWGSGIISFNGSTTNQSTGKQTALVTQHDSEVFGINATDNSNRGAVVDSPPIVFNGAPTTETTGILAALTLPGASSGNVTFSSSGIVWNTADAYTDPTQQISLQINEPFVIALNVTSGQKWVVSPNTSVELVQVFVKDNNPSDTGSDGVQYFCFISLVNGQTNLEFISTTVISSSVP